MRSATTIPDTNLKVDNRKRSEHHNLLLVLSSALFESVVFNFTLQRNKNNLTSSAFSTILLFLQSQSKSNGNRLQRHDFLQLPPQRQPYQPVAAVGVRYEYLRLATVENDCRATGCGTRLARRLLWCLRSLWRF